MEPAPQNFWKRRWKALLGAFATLAVLALGVSALSFGPLVRKQVATAAQRYGAEVEIGSVVPHYRSVTLRDVKVKLEDFPEAVIVLDEVEVSRGSPRVVHVRGGTIRVDAEPEHLSQDLATLRARLHGGSSGSGGGSTEIDATALELIWHAALTHVEADAKGVAIRRDGSGGSVIDVDHLDCALRGNQLHADGAHLELARDPSGDVTVAKLTTSGLIADLGSDAEPASDSPRSGSTSGDAGRLAGYRERLDGIASALRERVPPNAVIELGGVVAHLHLGKESLNFGPGNLRLHREQDQPVIEYASSAGSDGATFTIRSKLPLPGDALAVDVKGGPISLSTLGLKDGDFKLQNVAAATLTADLHLELDASAKTARASGSGTFERLSLDAKSISADPIAGLHLSVGGRAEFDLDGAHAHVDGGDLEFGALQVHGDVDYQRLGMVAEGEPRRFKLRSTFAVPLTACQSLLDAAPSMLIPTVHGIRMAGSLALKGHANLDTTNLDQAYDLDWTLSNSCRVTSVPPALDVKNFQHPFTRSVLKPNGEKTEITSGPGSGNWASYSHISKFMETAVMTSEDGRFATHDGFDHEAIKNSIRENLRTGKFVRGASTISMQLAKNLYLSRDKTISRKIEEAILTTYLEQTLTKEQIMELYLNVIELGPMVYGVEAAAAHYYHSTPAELSLSQAFYLASILPNPKVQHFGGAGAVSPQWMSHLRLLMKYANKRGRVSDDELDQGLSEIVVFGSPSPLHDPAAKDDVDHPGKTPTDGAAGADPASFDIR